MQGIVLVPAFSSEICVKCVVFQSNNLCVQSFCLYLHSHFFNKYKTKNEEDFTFTVLRAGESGLVQAQRGLNLIRMSDGCVMKVVK